MDCDTDREAQFELLHSENTVNKTSGLTTDWYEWMLASGLTLFAAGAFAMQGVMIKFREQVGSLELLCFRGVASAAVIIAVIGYKGESITPPNTYAMLYTILQLLFSGLSTCFYYMSVENLRIGDAVVLCSLSPIISAFVGRVWLKEAIRMETAVSLLLLTIAAVFVARPTFIFNIKTQDESDPMGILYGLTSSLFSGLGWPVLRQASISGATDLQLMFYTGIGFGISPIILSVLLPNHSFIAPKPWEWILLMSCFVSGFLYTVISTWSVRKIGAIVTSMLGSTDFFWAYLWEVFFFNLLPHPLSYVGGASVAVATLALALSPNVQTTQHPSPVPVSLPNAHPNLLLNGNRGVGISATLENGTMRSDSAMRSSRVVMKKAIKKDR